jgi:CRP-like cAMP-binding protein
MLYPVMSKPTVMAPVQGSRIVQDEASTILFGQPPEVLKGLLRNNIKSFDTMVLTDVKEKDGSVLNSLEFPFYFFLFVANGLAEGRKINLVGSEKDISHALRLLRLTLNGPNRAELDAWQTDEGLKEEWLAVSETLALSNAAGETIPIEDFFNLTPFKNGRAQTNSMIIEHSGTDEYLIRNNEGEVKVDLNEDQVVGPSYQVQPDYVPGGLAKMGLEVLGGASGFTIDEACTGLALCYNGDYILIDSIPFLDQHLFARGISKNQVSAIFLTHLHDDHCTMFPLMMMPQRVEVITTKEIYNMAMDKLGCSLGWDAAVIHEHFRLIEVVPGKSINYFGLNIEPHITVHSIPTIGATFSTIHKGYARQLCIVGDNHSMSVIKEMNKEGKVRDETLQGLERLYSQRFNMLVADGGAGAIHGDPADALSSQSDRVVFVHVDELPNDFNTTFSLASSGKRYSIIDGDPSIYTSQVNHYLTVWLGKPFPNRWMRSLLAEEEIRRYNAEDVIIVQDTETRGYVYLLLTGYCNVVYHDGKNFSTVANLQAGDIIGEMAVITGATMRNASVVATTPVTVCVFAEDTFSAFIEAEGFREDLLERWNIRPLIGDVPQFEGLSSTVIEKVGRIGMHQEMAVGESLTPNSDNWYILVKGIAIQDGMTLPPSSEFGWRPLAKMACETVTFETESSLLKFDRAAFEDLRLAAPQLNYLLRKFRVSEEGTEAGWILDIVSTN